MSWISNVLEFVQTEARTLKRKSCCIDLTDLSTTGSRDSSVPFSHWRHLAGGEVPQMFLIPIAAKHDRVTGKKDTGKVQCRMSFQGNRTFIGTFSTKEIATAWFLSSAEHEFQELQKRLTSAAAAQGVKKAKSK